MKQKNWKHAVALGLALAIVLSAGILNSGNWLHANEDETVAQEAPATEAPATEGVPEETQATQPAVQGNTVTEQIVLEETKPAETTAPTVAQEETKPVETTAPTVAQEETKPVETTAPTVAQEETKPVETTAPTVAQEETKPAETTAATEETTAPTEETTAPTEETTVPTEETQPILEAAELPLTVTLVDTEGNSVGDGTWTTTLKFDEGQAAASVTPPQIEGYLTQELTVERKAEDTELKAQAVYHLETPEEKTLEEMLDPNRSVKVELVTDAQVLHFGDTVKLKATLSGYDNVNYTLQWRYSVDGETWHNCPNQTGPEMTVEVSETNYMYYWNVLVTITGLK